MSTLAVDLRPPEATGPPDAKRSRKSAVPPRPWLEVERADLIAALAAVKDAVATRSAIEALAGVRVVSNDEGAHVWATDMSQAAWRYLPYSDGSAEGFDSLVNFALLVKALKAMPAGPVRLEEIPDGSRGGLQLRVGSRTIDLPGLRTEDYPATMPRSFKRTAAAAPGRDFADALTRVLPAASRDETRPALTGVLLDFQEHELVATDSYRLMVVSAPFEGVHRNLEALNVPGRMLAAARRALKEAGAEHVAFGVVDGWLVIDCGNTIWSARLIDGKYPNYRHLVPDEFPVQCTVDAAALIDSAQLCGEMARANAPLVFTLHHAELVVGVQSPDGPSVQDTLDARTLGFAEELRWGANPLFLAQCIAALEGDEVTIHVISELRPMKLTGSDGAFGLCMPIRLNV